MIFGFSDNNRKGSLSHRFRIRRFLFFRSLLDKLRKPIEILDIGGTEAYWKMMDFSDPQAKIILLNLKKQAVSSAQFESVAGNATDLAGIADKSVELVYSNSVIEHLYTFDNQQKMADEVRRVGRNYFIQTPDYYFLVEPHWVFPFFQFLPKAVRIWLTRNFSLGHIGRIGNAGDARQQVDEVRLLTRKEMQALFPEAKIYEEKVFFLTKSIVAYHFPGEAT